MPRSRALGAGSAASRGVRLAAIQPPPDDTPYLEYKAMSRPWTPLWATAGLFVTLLSAGHAAQRRLRNRPARPRSASSRCSSGSASTNGRNATRRRTRVSSPPDWWNLNTKNDVERIKLVLLDRFKFAVDDVLVLTDGQATRQGIIDAFHNHLVAKARPGNLVYFHYSGHRAADSR